MAQEALIARRGNLVAVVGFSKKILEFQDKDAAKNWVTGSGITHVRWSYIEDQLKDAERELMDRTFTKRHAFIESLASMDELNNAFEDLPG